MKSFFVSSFSLLLIVGTLSLAGCKSGGEATTEGNDSTLVSEPIGATNEAVNNLADNLFNKPVTVQEIATIALPASNLSPNAAPLPEILDATLSRESIVVFSQKIMAEMPDEVEFVQERSEHFTGPDGWNAFRIQYSTRPGKIGMVIFGAYQKPEQALWGSEVSSGLKITDLVAVQPAEGGVTVMGKYSDGSPFSATINANGVDLKRATAKTPA